MVQGLAFLSKKSWHTKNLNNQEKVWIAEQRMAAEESKAKELAREVQQERDREELDRLAGKKTHLDRGIDWMYQSQAAGEVGEPSTVEQKDATKRAEDFLLGKEYTAEGRNRGDFTQGKESGGVNAAVKLEASGALAAVEASASSAAGVLSVANRNEAFLRRVEDPLYLMKKQRSLCDRVVGLVRNEDSGEDDGGDDRCDRKRKMSRHERKCERKEQRRRQKDSRKTKRRRYQHHRHNSRGTSDSSDHERRERKQHGRATERDGYNRHGLDRCHHRHRSHDPNTSIADVDRERRHKRRRSGSSRDEKERRICSSNDQRHDGRSKIRKRKKSRSPGDTRHRCRFDDNGCDRDQGCCPRVDGLRGDNSDSNGKQGGTVLKYGYGLQVESTSTCYLHSSSTDLGPAEDLLLRKRQAAEEGRRTKERSSARCRITVAERTKALQEMQAAAQARRTRDNVDGRQAPS